jgi:hypothetical protein
MSAMIQDRAVERFAELAVVACFVLGLSLAVLGAATGLRWISSNWNTACHRLLRRPSPPRFAPPWRLSDRQPEAPCLHRRP